VAGCGGAGEEERICGDGFGCGGEGHDGRAVSF
jgi:hypothetical protein